MQNFLAIIATIAAITLAGFSGLWILRMLSDWKRERELVFLQVLIPKKESKEDKEQEAEQFSTGKDFREVLGVGDHLFQSLHGIFNHRISRFWRGQPFFSMEFAALAGEILSFIVCPRKISYLIEKQVTSFYPDAVIDQVEDYNIFTKESVVDADVLLPQKSWVVTFKTYQQLKSDPLNNVMNACSKLKNDEGAAMQFVLKPATQGWQKKVHAKAAQLLNPKKKSRFSWYNPLSWISTTLELLTSDKSQELKGEQPSSERISQVIDIHGNSFFRPQIKNRKDIIYRFIRRSPHKGFLEFLRRRPLLFGTAELASFFHFPNIKYNKVQNIKWQNFKIAPAPKNLPEDGLHLGYNTFRGDRRKIFIKNDDRFRHLYVIGQTGTGKSSIIQVMARQDFHNNKGVCIVDPHGSLVEDLFSYIPRERADDIIYFNPSDTERPMGLNMLEGKTEEEKDLIALDAMNMMVKMFGEEIFGPRIQDYFRN